ncbi:MAG: DEAD/DEAH box helicase [Nitrospirae bacterium]|nr:MAG: DEAD/DEAH box helicase [Nitrospirota bacterium]
MSDQHSLNDIPFSQGDLIIDRNNPGQPGQYTGRWDRAGSHIMLELSFPGGSTRWRPLRSLERICSDNSIRGRIERRHFGKVRDLQRLITYEKLKGTLYEIIYSMEAAQIDFYPYQFKPVLKFVDSPTERLIIADEVGLGKTIESALIWLELQARRQARRLLIIGPKMLAEKWREELRSKFLLDARIVDFSELHNEVEELKRNGPTHSYVLIATYTGLRPPKKELSLLKAGVLDDKARVTPKTSFLHKLRNWSLDYEAFDLVIFDEAHYMRNPATTTFALGESLAKNAGAVLCVSATPVNNKNADLHSLLRLVDQDFFATQGSFEDLLRANRPAVQAANALARTPVDIPLLQSAVQGMRDSLYIRQSPLFKQFEQLVDKLDLNDNVQIAKCQDLAEKLNLLGSYINRTRRVQVKENRPIRDPKVQIVEYSQEEMELYRAILALVRNKCRLDNRPFHVFQVIGLQLRAASCLPILAQEIKAGRFGDPIDLMNEAIGEEIIDEIFEEQPKEELKITQFAKLLNYDFEANDSKYQALRSILLDLLPNEKVLIYAYYRPTLKYLQRRLSRDGIKVVLIHGGIPNEQRLKEIDEFKTQSDLRVLLSSEVGSEGIDLQFCRIIINYDLPWNPMRVEQRIGRIDRIGQQAKRLSIVNFKVKDTIEERLYDCLHSKLERFANSLGDLEAVIGNEVQKLTIELLSRDLTPEQERQLIDQTKRVIEERLLQIEALEESGEALIAFSDYIQRKIEENRKRGRYIQPEELENYLIDFFDREFQGCQLEQNTPYEYCFRIRLTPEAQSSLTRFIADDRSLSARHLRQREFYISFRREVIQALPPPAQKTVIFINHLSPLIRWMTKINRDKAHAFFNVSALSVRHPSLPAGNYCYYIERWRFKGLSTREMLAYGVQSLNDQTQYSPNESEAIVQHLLREGLDWNHVDLDTTMLLQTQEMIENELSKHFSKALEDFEAENETAWQIKRQRIQNIFDRRIEQDERQLRSLKQARRDPRVIRATEGKLRVDRENKERRLRELNEMALIDSEREPIAAGVFQIAGTL